MITVKRKLNLRREEHGHVRVADKPSPTEAVEIGRVPRVSRLMALAIRFEQLLADGVVVDQSELARLAGVTQPPTVEYFNSAGRPYPLTSGCPQYDAFNPETTQRVFAQVSMPENQCSVYRIRAVAGISCP